MIGWQQELIGQTKELKEEQIVEMMQTKQNQSQKQPRQGQLNQLKQQQQPLQYNSKPEQKQAQGQKTKTDHVVIRVNFELLERIGVGAINQIIQTCGMKYQYLSSEQMYDIGPVKVKKLSAQGLSEDTIPIGLPNEGNTCFLNALLQFLFSASIYRDIMVQMIDKMDYAKATAPLIGQIFQLLAKNQLTSEQKDEMSQTLRQLVLNLETMNLTYRRFQQEDVFETLNNFIHNLDYPNEEDQDRISELFTIKVKKQCRCLNRPVILNNAYYSSNQKCQGCRESFEQTYLNAPDYLIATGSQILPEIKIKDKKQIYRFVSSIIYSGNGSSGHYVCLREQEKKLYQLNDSQVNEVSSEYLKSCSQNFEPMNGGSFYRKPIVSLYKKLTKNEAEQLKQQKQKKYISILTGKNFIIIRLLLLTSGLGLWRKYCPWNFQKMIAHLQRGYPFKLGQLFKLGYWFNRKKQ